MGEMMQHATPLKVKHGGHHTYHKYARCAERVVAFHQARKFLFDPHIIPDNVVVSLHFSTETDYICEKFGDWLSGRRQ